MFFRGHLALFLSFVFWTPYLKKKHIERHFFKGLKYFLILLYIIYDFVKNVASGYRVTCSGRTQCAQAPRRSMLWWSSSEAQAHPLHWVQDHPEWQGHQVEHDPAGKDERPPGEVLRWLPALKQVVLCCHGPVREQRSEYSNLPDLPALHLHLWWCYR